MLRQRAASCGAALVAFAALLTVHARTAPPPSPRLPALAAGFLGPAALVGLAAGLQFWRAGLLRDVVQFTVLNHFVGMSKFAYASFPDTLPLFAQDPALRSADGLIAYAPAIVTAVDWKLVRESGWFRETPLYDVALKLYYLLPLAFVAFGALRLWRRRAELSDPGGRRARLAEAGLFALAAVFVGWVRVNKPQDYAHLAVLYWPVLRLPLLWLAEALGRLRARRPRLAAATLALLLVPASAIGAYSARLAWRLRALHDTPIPSERAGIFVTKGQAALLGDAVAWVQAGSRPGETVAVLPYFPILQFLADRPGPDRSGYIVWPFPELPDRDQRMIASFEAKRPELLLYDLQRLAGFPDVRAYAPELYAYLVEHYAIERTFSDSYAGYKLAGARRRHAAEPGQPLGDAALSAASLVVDSDEAPPLAIPPDERSLWLARDLWPFRPVLALRPASEGRTTRLRIPLELPPGARLRTAVAAHPEAWYAYPPSAVHFEIAALADGVRTPLFERTLRTTSEPADRGWSEVDVPLEAWAGRSVRLELSTAAERPTGATLTHGGFAEPRIVTPGDAAPPPASPR